MVPRSSPQTWSVRALRCALGAAFALGLSGCLGGQTGTEATPGVGGRGGSVVTGDPSPSATTDTSARSGNDASCAVAQGGTAGLEAQAGIGVAAVVDFIQTSNPVEIRYDDGTLANANVTIASLATGCLAVTSSGPASLSVPVSVLIQSDDGRLTLNIGGNAVAYAAANGTVAEVELSAVTQCVRTADPTSVAACAVGAIDQSPYATVMIGLSARVQAVAGDAVWLGNLRISGSPSGACGAGPCVIGDWVTIATMAFTSVP